MLIGSKVVSFEGRWHRDGQVIDIRPAGNLMGPCYRQALPGTVGASTLPLGGWGTIALVRWPDGSEAWQSTSSLSLAA